MVRLAVSLFALLILPNFVFAQNVVATRQLTHEVVEGETLWSIAQRYLGDPFKWPVIFEANRERIQDPNSISPGQELTIPEAVAGGATVQILTVTTLTGDTPVPEEGVPLIRIVGPPSSDPVRSPMMAERTIFYQNRGGAPRAGRAIPSPAAKTAFSAPERATPPPQAISIGSSILEDGLLPVPGGVVFGADWLESQGTEPGSIGALARYSPGQPERLPGGRALLHDRIQIRVWGDAKLQPGDLLQSFRVLREEEGLGTIVRPTGLLIVMEAGEEVEVLLTAEFGWARLGDRVRMAPSYDSRPGEEAASVNSNVTAKILGFPVKRAIQGPGALAFLDVGEKEGIVIGDEFQAFESRPGGSFGMEAATLQVVLVNGNVSTARVTNVKRPTLGAGDRLRLIKKMY
jgi:hypothetical protein